MRIGVGGGAGRRAGVSAATHRAVGTGAQHAGVEVNNDKGTKGYTGPCPPKGNGVHHYHFKLFALDATLDLPSGVDKHTLLEAISGHVLARGELVGTYHR